MDYGSLVTFGTVAAPRLFTGITKRWDLGDKVSEQLLPNMAGANRALALHSHERPFSFEAEVTAASTDFLSLSNEAGALVISGGPSGTSLVEYCDEYWVSLMPKVCSVRGVNFPDVVLGSGTLAAVTLSAFTAGVASLAFPGDDIIYSVGAGHASGEVHSLRLIQQLTLRRGKVSPDGKYKHAHTFGYLRRINLAILLIGSGALPATQSTLTLTGAPGHAADHKITSVSPPYEFLGERMCNIDAVWIPPFTA